ncbi:class GN sortase [Sneathiella sp.]|jgi:sortase A|uniref:class GN sortase n=1 Tax=Sneathiella sp. TaxID=1964365 RepID=UPI0039E6B307
MKRLLTTCLFGGLLLLAMWQLGQAGLLAAKAWAAPVLIKQAWEQQRETGRSERPWPWADSFPVARLAVPTLQIERFVLEGDNARNLAFGPVLHPNDKQTILFGHRDTHFQFLQDLVIGDTATVERQSGKAEVYRVMQTQIIPAENLSVPHLPERSLLVLVTCYPFDGLNPDTDRRYVVILEAHSNSAPAVGRS